MKDNSCYMLRFPYGYTKVIYWGMHLAYPLPKLMLCLQLITEANRIKSHILTFIVLTVSIVIDICTLDIRTVYSQHS